MGDANREEGRYRVLLLAIGGNTQEEKEAFCQKASEAYGISGSQLRSIADRCPIVLKKNLTRKLAESLARNLKSMDAMISIEERRDPFDAFLEFQEMTPPVVALESSYLRRTASGVCQVIGRVRNVSDRPMRDVWILLQVFDPSGEIVTFEEVPTPINFLPPGVASPFKVVFDEASPIAKGSIAFKTPSGDPIAAVDRRKKREWVAVEMADEQEAVHPSVEQQHEDVTPSKATEEASLPGTILLEEVLDRRAEAVSAPKDTDDRAAVDLWGPGGEDFETGNQSPLSLSVDDLPAESPLALTEREGEFSWEDTHPAEREDKEPEEPLNSPRWPGNLARALSPAEAVKAHPTLTAPQESEEAGGLPASEPRGPAAAFEEAAQLLEEISQKSPEKKVSAVLFPWIDDFRSSVEAYHQRATDAFSAWFGAKRSENGFSDPFHSLLAIVGHGRFDQASQSERTTENIERVYKLLPEPRVELESIPALIGTEFCSGENWTYLFHRALPRLQHVAREILEKKAWKGLDLERLIQTVPHMSPENSRKTAQRIRALLPDAVAVDLSEVPVTVGEGLYRVASRLGVVDPQFDVLGDQDSMGSRKIQAFAETAFPQDPARVEEPMASVGRGDDRGFCLPVHPRCAGCLFDAFCSKQHVDFDPSERGMRVR